MAGNMLKIDIRRGKILEKLKRDGAVSVSQLSTELGATPVTIRSDLDALGKDGYLMRVQGGAVQKVQAQSSPMLISKNIANTDEKRAIAKAVCDMVEDGDVLFINFGSTVQMIASELKNRSNLNIVTNAMAVAMELGNIPTFRVILLGGEINAQYGFVHGSDAQEQIGRYRANKAILSLDGISAVGGMTTYHAEESSVNSMMINQAMQVIVAADHTKIGRTGFFHFNAIPRGTCLVTTKKAPADAVAELEQQGVQVHYADSSAY